LICMENELNELFFQGGWTKLNVFGGFPSIFSINNLLFFRNHSEVRAASLFRPYQPTTNKKTPAPGPPDAGIEPKSIQIKNIRADKRNIKHHIHAHVIKRPAHGTPVRVSSYFPDDQCDHAQEESHGIGAARE
jgi:hypothetical protein